MAQQVVDNKNTADVRPVYQKDKAVAGTRPNTLISDGAPNYRIVYNKESFTLKNSNTRHISHIRSHGEHNNKVERLNGEIRDSEKTIGGLKKRVTPILKGIQIFHNYIRTYHGLDNMTPIQRCWVEIEGAKKWKTLI
jgi:hypothetical protein